MLQIVNGNLESYLLCLVPHLTYRFDYEIPLTIITLYGNIEEPSPHSLTFLLFAYSSKVHLKFVS